MLGTGCQHEPAMESGNSGLNSRYREVLLKVIDDPAWVRKRAKGAMERPQARPGLAVGRRIKGEDGIRNKFMGCPDKYHGL